MVAPTGIISAAALAARLGPWDGRGASGASTARRVPLHTALADRLTALVLDGRLPVGAQLPAERVLCAQLNVSRTTVTAAYALLRDSGFAVSRQGSGTYTAVPLHAVAGSGGGWTASAPEIGDDLIDMKCAAPCAPLPEIQTVLRQAAQMLPRYAKIASYQPYGLDELREAIADRYTRRGVPTTPDQVIVTSGAQGAISLTARLLLRGGDRVLVDSPTYPNALDTFRAQQARPVPVPMGEEGWVEGAFEGALEQLRGRLAYIVPHFQNPTGLVMREEQQASIARAARRSGAWLLADETMTDTGIGPLVTAGVGPGRPMPFAASVGAADAERVLVCGSLAKSFWGGLRVGWLRGPSRVIHELAAARAALDLGSPILDQLAGLAVLRSGEGHLEGHRRQWIEQRAALMRAVDSTFPEWEYRVPEGGLCLWVRMDRDDATTLAHRAQTHGLLVHAGPRFGTDPGTFERYLRLPYTLPPEDLAEGVRRLALARQVTGPMPTAEHRSDLVA